MTFSTVVAAIAFVVVSFLLLAVMGDAVLNQKEHKAKEDIARALNIPYQRYNMPRLMFVIAVWFASGVYLFG